MFKTRKCIIDWSPKSGCTVVKKMWFDRMGVLEQALCKTNWVHDFMPTYFKKFGGQVTQADLESDFFIKIKYVRNPYARAVSSFMHVAKTKLIQHFPADMNFRDFLHLIPERLDELGSGHWAVQNKYPEIIYDEIIKIENIHDKTERLNKKYNLNLNSDRTSGHHSLDLNHEKINDAFNIPADAIKTLIRDNSKPLPTYDSFYNDEIKQMVDEFYGIDIESYQYEFPY